MASQQRRCLCLITQALAFAATTVPVCLTATRRHRRRHRRHTTQDARSSLQSAASSSPATPLVSGVGFLAEAATVGVGAPLATLERAKRSGESLLGGYASLQAEHYLAMAFLQAGVLASTADVATQSMEAVATLDLGHVGAMATVAAVMSGAVNAVWLRQLEAHFPGTWRGGGGGASRVRSLPLPALLPLPLAVLLP